MNLSAVLYWILCFFFHQRTPLEVAVERGYVDIGMSTMKLLHTMDTPIYLVRCPQYLRQKCIKMGLVQVSCDLLVTFIALRIVQLLFEHGIYTQGNTIYCAICCNYYVTCAFLCTLASF